MSETSKEASFETRLIMHVVFPLASLDVAGEERDRYNKVQSELRRLDRQRWGEY
ncbi:hypothetical protein QF049_003417 [Paenibacillus sp. W4I10]|uniref:hypothetical protein n=1 Tax=Paenibacillus TaxID=44249 RepID=UPI00278426E7|nr:hypothetical protein [Paenibacillus sp. W4I10]MDQ0722156.1 hypothetical protein [Paenibacillus sp. W4I10]